MNPTKKERRASHRYIMTDMLCVTVAPPGITLESGMFSINDVSLSGISIFKGPSQFLYPPRTVVKVRLGLPHSLKFVELWARVRRVKWAGKAQLMGLEWGILSNSEFKALESWVSYHKDQQLSKVCRKLLDDLYHGFPPQDDLPF